jgi:hypothetical protein
LPPTVIESKSTVTRSFRLSPEILSTLDEEAERMGISVNALVGTILQRYSDFTRYLSKIDMVVVNREFLTTLLESNDEETVHRLGMKLGETVLVDTVIFWRKEITQKAVLDYIEKVICRYGHFGTYDEKQISQTTKTIVIRHRLGRKGSRFLEGYLRSGIKHSIGYDATFEATDSSIKFDMRDQ